MGTNPAEMRTAAEFFCGLKKVKIWSEKSFTELADRSSQLGYPLARSTLHALCSDRENKKLPPTFRQVEHFLRACDLPAEQIPQWEAAYRRLATGESVTMPVGEVGDFESFQENDFEPAGRLGSAVRAALWVAVGVAIGIPAGALLF